MEVFPEVKVVLTIRDPENWYKSVKETIYQGNMDRQMFPVNIYSWVNGSSKQLNMMETFTHASNNRFDNGKYGHLHTGQLSHQFFPDKCTA